MTDEPKSLGQYVAWYRREVADLPVPIRLHSRDTDSGGTPDWSGGLRAWLSGNPCSVDREGYVISWLRCRLGELYRHGGKDKRRSEFLWRLAYNDGDWLTAVRSSSRADRQGEYTRSHWPETECARYAEASLRILWRLMQSEPVRYVRPPVEKSESQHRAEEAELTAA
jgi:hypothetical protein